MEDRFEAAREVVRRLNFGEGWEAALDPDMPPEIHRLARGIVQAYARVDLEWLLQHRDPDIEMTADIYFLMRCESDRITNWDMFMTEEQALGRAAERRADRDDNHAAQGDRRERA